MSVSVYAGKQVGDTTDWVFTKEEMTERLYKDVFDSEDEGQDNPKYRPELDINMANRNARIVVEALGIEYDEGFHTPIDEFIGRCTSYLQAKMGKPTPGFAGEWQGRIFDGGLDDGYVEKQVHRMVVMAREGKERGANCVYGA